jgi:mannose/fructose-specific phosphotransferase system component IIA
MGFRSRRSAGPGEKEKTGVRAFRIVIAAHGELASAFVGSAEMICGPIDDMAAVGLLPEHSPELFADLLRAAIGDDGRPLLILTDLRGGTPYNVACIVARGRPNTVTIAGLNLGILIEAATSLPSLDEDAIEQLVLAGRASIVESTTRLVRTVS